MMRMLVFVVLTACGTGTRYAHVGELRARDRVAYRACLEDDAGNCVDEKTVEVHEPARGFWGLAAFAAVGPASVTSNGLTQTRTRGETSAEVLVGRGGKAIGMRASYSLDFGEARTWSSAAVGYLALSDRFSVHAGLGYTPYVTRMAERSHLGARGVAGLDVAVGRIRDVNLFMFGVEVDTLVVRLDRVYRSSALLAHLSIYL